MISKYFRFSVRVTVWVIYDTCLYIGMYISLRTSIKEFLTPIFYTCFVVHGPWLFFTNASKKCMVSYYATDRSISRAF